MLNLTELHLIPATRKYPLPVEQVKRPRDQDSPQILRNEHLRRVGRKAA